MWIGRRSFAVPPVSVSAGEPGATMRSNATSATHSPPGHVLLVADSPEVSPTSGTSTRIFDVPSTSVTRKSAPNFRPRAPVSNAARSSPNSIRHVSPAASHFRATALSSSLKAAHAAFVSATAASRMCTAERGKETSPYAGSQTMSTATVRPSSPSLRTESVASDWSLPKSSPFIGDT